MSVPPPKYSPRGEAPEVSVNLLPQEDPPPYEAIFPESSGQSLEIRRYPEVELQPISTNPGSKKNMFCGVLIFLLIFKMGVVLLRMHKEDNRRTDEAQRKTWFESQPKKYDWAQPEDIGHSNSVLLKSLQGLSSNVTAIIGSEPSKRMEKLEDVAKNPRGFFNSFYKSMNKTV